MAVTFPVTVVFDLSLSPLLQDAKVSISARAQMIDKNFFIKILLLSFLPV